MIIQKESFFVDCQSHSQLSEKVNDCVMGKKVSASKLFQMLADNIVSMDLLGMGGGDDDDFIAVADDVAIEDDPFIRPEKSDKPHWDAVDEKYRKQTFVHESSSEATLRLISDVKALLRSNSQKWIYSYSSKF